MSPSVEDQVIDFYYNLFDRIFSDAFRASINERLRRDTVKRQVDEAAAASSQSLTRFFLNQQLTERQVADILAGLSPLANSLKIADIANPNITPESLVEELLTGMPCPDSVERAECGPVYRVALHSLVQTLMLVGSVMAEWQRLGFSSTFELPRRVVNRLNEISAQMAAMGTAGQDAADERYELTYRDYLLQRFNRVEAGTVKMATNLNVDLRELFVMPRVKERPRAAEAGAAGSPDPASLMDLAAARRFFGVRAAEEDGKKAEADEQGVAALEQVRRAERNVIVGAPGGGKSTFLEWLQLKLASVEEVFEMNGEQAIPLLLRMRQLDAKRLPRGAALIERATSSRDRAALMPAGWIERQMRAGRVLFMLDGLDETEPRLRDRYVLPWLKELCDEYPGCRFLVSSRPVGYPAGALEELNFAECDLLDFGEPEVAEYTRHWCTAVRLAQNEPEEEARQEGEADGQKIVEGFAGHQYIPTLVRNPLMLSAVCLVNYFEGGQLPKDRAKLYHVSSMDFYKLHGPDFMSGISHSSQAEVAMIALGARKAYEQPVTLELDSPLLQILRVLSKTTATSLNQGLTYYYYVISEFFSERSKLPLPEDSSAWPEFAKLTRGLAESLESAKGRGAAKTAQALNSWADKLEAAVATEKESSADAKSPKNASKKAAKKAAKRRR